MSLLLHAHTCYGENMRSAERLIARAMIKVTALSGVCIGIVIWIIYWQTIEKKKCSASQILLRNPPRELFARRALFHASCPFSLAFPQKDALGARSESDCSDVGVFLRGIMRTYRDMPRFKRIRAQPGRLATNETFRHFAPICRSLRNTCWQ